MEQEASPGLPGAPNEKPKKWRRVAQCLYIYEPSGVYYARARVRGKLKVESLRTRDRALANRKLRAWRDRQEKIDPTAGDVVLEGLVESFTKMLKGADSTVSQKRGVLKHLLERWPADAPRRVSRIRQGHIKAWLATFQFGACSYNVHLWTVREMFAQAVADHVIAENPADGIGSETRRRPVRLTPSWEQFAAIVEDIRGRRGSRFAKQSADLIEFMGLCGVGQAEAWGLRWGRVDFGKGEMALFRVKTRTAYTVPIYPQARPLMERLRAEAGGHPHPESRVFAIKNPKKAIENACKRLGYHEFTPRSLRRMFVTRSLELGVSVKSVSKWQGHQDGGVLILRDYSHLLDAQSRRDADKMVDDDPPAGNVVPFAPAAG